VATWLTVKLPTGDAERLSGSGATDVALSVAASRELSDRWQPFGQASLVWLGEGDLLPELQEDYAGSLLAGLTWQATAAFELTGQLEANTAVFSDGRGSAPGRAASI
jgi:hypothetical protein